MALALSALLAMLSGCASGGASAESKGEVKGEGFSLPKLPDLPSVPAVATVKSTTKDSGITERVDGPEGTNGASPWAPNDAARLRLGIQSSGGAGKALADWIVDGHPPMDLWDVDVRRMMPFQRNASYLRDRTVGLFEPRGDPLRQFLGSLNDHQVPFFDDLHVFLLRFRQQLSQFLR